ncbi:MAG: tetratricopeptide repeat protein, partial [Deltaproteobacteria bacterium]
LMEPRVTVAGEKAKAPPVWRRKAILAGGVAFVVVVIAAVIWNFYFRPPPIEPASVEKMAYPLPDKPSIAVLPFVNMSGDPEQEFLSDGLTEELITALSKSERVFVIARNSVFTYKGKAVKVQRVSEDLGVCYVLEGSVRRAGDKVRITAQLIDAIKGHHLWSERYERDLKNIFALQDDITMKIMSSLQVKLTDGEQARLYEKGTDSLEAYLKCLQGLELVYRFSKEGLDMARPHLKEAITLDPNYAAPYRWLGGTYLLEVILGVSKSPKQSIRQGMKYAKKAIALDDSFAPAHCLLSHLFSMIGQHEKAIAQAERAIAANPNVADSHGYLAMALTLGGRPEEAIPVFEKAIRHNPIPPKNYLYVLSLAYRYVGQYDKAIPLAKEILSRDPNDLMARQILAVNYGLAGCEEEARIEVEELLKRNPRYSLERVAKMGFPSKHRVVQSPLVLEALRKAGLPEKPPLPLPDKPSIAVLPFVNMSEDPKQEYFSDGITEEIITALSKTPKLFVIARNSTFTYKGKPVKVQQVGRELGVRYVLEGSVRKAAHRVRITAQLVDARTGHHLWAERYDRDLKDIFAIQDEITMKIITALQVELTEGEQARIWAKGTDNLEAYLLCLQAGEQIRRMNKDVTVRGRQMAEKAIALDPNYALAYRRLAITYANEVPLRLSKDPRQSIARAMELAKKAIALDESLASAHSLLGWLYTLMRQHDKGIPECEQAVSLEPNSATAHLFLGLALRYAGRHKEAITMCKEAIRLDPIPWSGYYQSLTNAYCLAGQYEEAITAGRKAVRLEPNNLIAHAFLAAAYSLHGREEEAHIEAGEVLRIDPKFSVEHWAKTMPYKNEADRELTINALRKAGLK